MSAGWAIGLAVGAVIVLVVVVLLLLLIRGASATAEKAEAILAALHDTRDNTAGLWRLDHTNHTASRIVEAAAAARTHLSTNGDGS